MRQKWPTTSGCGNCQRVGGAGDRTGKAERRRRSRAMEMIAISCRRSCCLAAEWWPVYSRSLDTKERRLQQLQHMVEQLLRWRYGPKRERVNENQLFLYAVGSSARQEILLFQRRVNGNNHTPTSRTCRRRYETPRAAARVYDLGKQERKCPQARELQHIGEESVTAEYVPASLYVIEEACQKYACGKAARWSQRRSRCSRSRRSAGTGLLAHVAVSNMAITSVVPSEGITSAKEWPYSAKPCATGSAVPELVRPLFERMKEQVLESKPCRRRHTGGGFGSSASAHAHGEDGPMFGDDEHPNGVRLHSNRSRDGPDAFLKEFSGFRKPSVLGTTSCTKILRAT